MEKQPAYVEGEVYFRITYPDSGLMYPKIESLVFLGLNLADDDSQNSWYFQFADSFARDGPVGKGTRGEYRRVAIVTESDLAEMLSLDDAVNELRAAKDRRTANMRR